MGWRESGALAQNGSQTTALFGRWPFAILLHQEQCLSPHDRPVSEERHPSFELSPFGRISDNPSSLSPNVLGLRGVSQVEAQKASENASAPQHIRGGHGPTGKCQTEPVAVDAWTGAGIDIARARAQPVDGQTRGQTDRPDQTRPRQGETSVLLVPLHQVLCVFDGQHPMLSGEITLSQPGHGRVGWDGMGQMDGVVPLFVVALSIRRRDT